MSAVITGSQNGTVGLINAGTAVASTSGTSIDFTSIPAGVRRITVMFNGVSTSGTSAVIVQLGTASGVETTSYLATQGIVITTTPATASYTTGFPVGGTDAGNTRSGQMILTLLGSNVWVSSAVIKGGTGTMAYSAGDKTTSATLDRVRITTVNGTDTFDAGSINILYE